MKNESMSDYHLAIANGNETTGEDIVILANKILERANVVGNVQEVTLLGKGGFSSCYRLKMDNGEMALKVRRDDEGWRLKREYNLLSHQLLIGQNLGPKVFAYDDSGELMPFPYLLQELVKGSNPVEGNVHEEFIRAAAEWYKKLHRLTSDRLKETEDERQEEKWINSLSLWLKHDEYRIKKADRTRKLERSTLDSVKTVLARVKDLFVRHDAIFFRNIYNFTHGDPAAENIFIQPDGSLKFIDWDFAGFHIFEADLAEFAYTWELTVEQEKFFLRHYGLDLNKETMTKFYLMQLKLLIDNIVGWLLGVADEDFETPVIDRVKQMENVIARIKEY